MAVSSLEKKLVIAIDQVEDQSDFNLHDLTPCWWIPQFVPLHTRILFSTSNKGVIGIRKGVLHEYNCVETGNLTSTQVYELLAHTPRSSQIYSTGFDSRLVKIASWSKQSGKDGVSIISGTLEKLRINHGTIIDIICSLLSTSKSGLSKSCLIDLLSCSNEKLSNYTSKSEVIKRFPADIFLLAMRDLVDSCVCRSFISQDGIECFVIPASISLLFKFDQKAASHILADYFSGKYSTRYPSRYIGRVLSRTEISYPRQVWEQFSALRKSDRIKEHAEMLCNLHIISTVCQMADGVSNLLDEFEICKDSHTTEWQKRLDIFRQFLLANYDVILKDTDSVFTMAYNSSKNSLPARAAAFLASKNERFWSSDDSNPSRKMWLKLKHRFNMEDQTSKYPTKRIQKCGNPVSQSPINSVAFSSDGLYCLTLSENGAKLIDISTRSVVWEFDIQNPNTLEFCPASPNAVLISEKTVYSLNTLDGSFVAKSTFQSETATCSSTYAGSNIFEQFTAIGTCTGRVQVLNKYGAPLCVHAAHSTSVVCLSWNYDGILATGSSAGAVRVWSYSPELALKYTISHHLASVNDCAWMPLYSSDASPNMKMCDSFLAVASADGNLSVWTFSNILPVICASFSCPNSIALSRLSWNNDGNRIAVGDYNGNIFIWSWRNSECIYSIDARPNVQVKGISRS